MKEFIFLGYVFSRTSLNASSKYSLYWNQQQFINKKIRKANIASMRYIITFYIHTLTQSQWIAVSNCVVCHWKVSKRTWAYTYEREREANRKMCSKMKKEFALFIICVNNLYLVIAFSVSFSYVKFFFQLDWRHPNKCA